MFMEVKVSKSISEEELRGRKEVKENIILMLSEREKVDYF